MAFDLQWHKKEPGAWGSSVHQLQQTLLFSNDASSDLLASMWHLAVHRHWEKHRKPLSNLVAMINKVGGVIIQEVGGKPSQQHHHQSQSLISHKPLIINSKRRLCNNKSQEVRFFFFLALVLWCVMMSWCVFVNLLAPVPGPIGWPPRAISDSQKTMSSVICAGCRDHHLINNDV